MGSTPQQATTPVVHGGNFLDPIPAQPCLASIPARVSWLLPSSPGCRVGSWWNLDTPGREDGWGCQERDVPGLHLAANEEGSGFSPAEVSSLRHVTPPTGRRGLKQDASDEISKASRSEAALQGDLG